jgi:3-deoxy-manno-octulosonate cytidylyltransferase (CMP-KDO synthetase)
LPAKALADIAGKPMIQWVYEACKTSGLFDVLIIATDHEKIYEASKSFGANVRMTSADHHNGTERIAEVVEKENLEVDVVVNIQGDEPFIQSKPIEALVQAFARPDTRIASLYREVDDTTLFSNPSIIKVVTDKQDVAIYFSRSPIPFHREEPTSSTFKKHIGLYAFRPSTLLELVKLPMSDLERLESLEQLRWLEHGYQIQMIKTENESISVDTTQDLEKARQIAKGKI